MNNQLINLQPDPIELSRTRSVTPMLKLIVVSMGGLTLALRIESVYNITACVPTLSDSRVGR